MTIISNKEKKEIAARPERETEHKTRKMDEGGRKPRGGRKPSKLVIYIYIYIIYINNIYT